MPGMSGLDLQEHLAGKGMHVPVVIITGHGDIAIDGEKLGARLREGVMKAGRDEARPGALPDRENSRSPAADP